jgi:hypothetical protein
MRKKQDWMELTQDEINSMTDENWSHYEGGGCLCFAHDSSECVCGSYDRKPVKRKPFEDGTLDLSKEEMEEFWIMWTGKLKRVHIERYGIKRFWVDKRSDETVLMVDSTENGVDVGSAFIRDLDAILWLSDRFDLVTK